jgi:hypothetical protein
MSTVDGRALWGTDTAVAGSRLDAPWDGNIVVYSPAGQAIWAADV